MQLWLVQRCQVLLWGSSWPLTQSQVFIGSLWSVYKSTLKTSDWRKSWWTGFICFFTGPTFEMKNGPRSGPRCLLHRWLLPPAGHSLKSTHLGHPWFCCTFCDPTWAVWASGCFYCRTCGLLTVIRLRTSRHLLSHLTPVVFLRSALCSHLRINSAAGMCLSITSYMSFRGVGLTCFLRWIMMSEGLKRVCFWLVLRAGSLPWGRNRHGELEDMFLLHELEMQVLTTRAPPGVGDLLLFKRSSCKLSIGLQTHTAECDTQTHVCTQIKVFKKQQNKLFTCEATNIRLMYSWTTLIHKHKNMFTKSGLLTRVNRNEEHVNKQNGAWKN